MRMPYALRYAGSFHRFAVPRIRLRIASRREAVKNRRSPNEMPHCFDGRFVNRPYGEIVSCAVTRTKWRIVSAGDTRPKVGGIAPTVVASNCIYPSVLGVAV